MGLFPEQFSETQTHTRKTTELKVLPLLEMQTFPDEETASVRLGKREESGQQKRSKQHRPSVRLPHEHSGIRSSRPCTLSTGQSSDPLGHLVRQWLPLCCCALSEHSLRQELLEGAADRSELTLFVIAGCYLFMCLYGKTCFWHVWLTHKILNPRSTNCLMLT